MSAPEYFSEGLSSGRLNSVNCSGAETEILECDHVSSDRGFSCDSAGVVCQGMAGQSVLCTFNLA